VLHRSKRHCLDLPPKQRRHHPVHLDAAAAADFQHRLDAAVARYRRRAARGEVRRDAEALAAFTALRRIGSLHKLPATGRLVEELLDAGESVVVFTAFVDTAESLHRALAGERRGVLLVGRVPQAARQGLVDTFQSGERRLLVATMGTGGLGFTLHRARHVVLVERPWTPGDAEQAEDRCHRIGMGSCLTAHWLQLGVADRLVDGLIADKAERIQQVLGGPAQDRRRFTRLLRELLERW
jgi:SNF2 family DNA or RNA helicase